MKDYPFLGRFKAGGQGVTAFASSLIFLTQSSEKSNFIFEVIFDNDDHIYVNADRYDHNVYTNIVSFQVFTDEGTGKGYATTIGTFNMNNLIGIRKISFIKSKDIVGEI